MTASEWCAQRGRIMYETNTKCANKRCKQKLKLYDKTEYCGKCWMKAIKEVLSGHTIQIKETR